MKNYIKNINYIVSFFLVTLWAVGYFKHFAGVLIHILLIVAFNLILINIISENTNYTNKSKT